MDCDFTSREMLDKTMRDIAADLQLSYRSLMLHCRLAITGVKVRKKVCRNRRYREYSFGELERCMLDSKVYVLLHKDLSDVMKYKKMHA